MKRSRLAREIIILLARFQSIRVRAMSYAGRLIQAYRHWRSNLETYKQRNIAEWQYWGTRRALREAKGLGGGDDPSKYRRLNLPDASRQARFSRRRPAGGPNKDASDSQRPDDIS
jgi:hypothetical protein